MAEHLTAKLGTTVPTYGWLVDPLTEEVKAAIRRLARAPDVCQLAVMPDVHLAHDVCIGVVIATSQLVYPQAVGGDIGCGVTCARTDLTLSSVLGKERSVLAALQRAVPVLRRPSQMAHLPEVVAPDAPKFGSSFWSQAAIEFGTLGRGNHFLEVQVDTEEQVWVCVHSGSRCAGQHVAARAMSHALRGGGGLKYLDSESEYGREYLAASEWCFHYASASRTAMLEAATAEMRKSLDRAIEMTEVMNTAHNCITRESHEGREFLIHRKGASTARRGEAVVIPGSMGTSTVHAVGLGCAESLCSSSHGAGRVMSRTEARAKITQRDLLRETRGVMFDDRLAKSLVEESPSAYRDIRKVMRAQSELVKSVRTLRTIVCHKGA